VPALILLNDEGTSVVGRDNYLNDLLASAGGNNVVQVNGYLRMDREKLQTFAPKVIFILLPGARQEVVRTAVTNTRQIFNKSDPRVVTLTEPDALLPASNVGRLAGTFARELHPTSQPAAQ
jgi:hypothetical protein